VELVQSVLIGAILTNSILVSFGQLIFCALVLMKQPLSILQVAAMYPQQSSIRMNIYREGSRKLLFGAVLAILITAIPISTKENKSIEPRLLAGSVAALELGLYILYAWQTFATSNHPVHRYLGTHWAKKKFNLEKNLRLMSWQGRVEFLLACLVNLANISLCSVAFVDNLPERTRSFSTTVGLFVVPSFSWFFLSAMFIGSIDTKGEDAELFVFWLFSKSIWVAFFNGPILVLSNLLWSPDYLLKFGRAESIVLGVTACVLFRVSSYRGSRYLICFFLLVLYVSMTSGLSSFHNITVARLTFIGRYALLFWSLQLASNNWPF
jgi:Ca2+/H+ antiporter